jgi:hypothetical protein
MAGPLSLQPWQWAVIAIAYVLFFAVPAVWMWRRAQRDGDHAFVWTMLVLVGSVMGIVEYYEHRSILKRREERGRRERERDGKS